MSKSNAEPKFMVLDADGNNVKPYAVKRYAIALAEKNDGYKVLDIESNTYIYPEVKEQQEDLEEESVETVEESTEEVEATSVEEEKVTVFVDPEEESVETTTEELEEETSEEITEEVENVEATPVEEEVKEEECCVTTEEDTTEEITEESPAEEAKEDKTFENHHVCVVGKKRKLSVFDILKNVFGKH